METESVYQNGHIPMEEVSLSPELEKRVKEEEEVDRKSRKRRNTKPLLLCQLIVDYPKLAFIITLSGHLLLTGMNGILALTGYDIIPVEFERFPVTLRETDVLKRDWGWAHRNRGRSRVQRLTINDTAVNPIRGVPGDFLQVLYESKSGNIFTEQSLKRIKQIEETLFNDTKFQNVFCQWDSNSRCIKPESIIRYFDGTHRNKSPVLYDPEFKNIPGVIYEANSNPETRGNFQFHLSHNAVITRDRVISHASRTSFTMGWPIPGKERGDIGIFLADHLSPKIDKLRDELPNDMGMYYFSFRMFLIAAPRQAFMDMGLAFGSLLFIFAFIWFQTGTFWVTFWSVFSIVSCFFITNLFYRTVIGYRYFGYFHIIVIFIILGIGADDIFVFFNTWKATQNEEYRSLAHRLSDCYRRAAATMFVTSLTTTAAFLVSGLSPLLPVHSFGVFSGLLVAVNYISVIVFFPAVVIMYHNLFEEYQPPCCKVCKKSDTAHEGTVRKNDMLVRFFAGPFYRFITHKIIRWLLILVFLATAGFFGWAVSKLRADSEQIQIYRLETNIGKAWNMIYGNTFRPTDSEYIPVLIAWGVGNQNLSRCKFSETRCRGDPTFDDRFDMNFPNVQLALKDFCHKLKYRLTPDELDRLKIRNDSITGELHVDCFIENMERYMLKEAKYLKESQGVDLDLTVPLTARKMRPFMEAYDPLLYNTSLSSDTFYRYFEIAVGHWMTNGYTMLSTPDYYKFVQVVGEILDPPNTHLVNFIPPELPVRRIGFEYGTRLRYAAIKLNLSVSFLGLGYTDGIPIYDAWEDFTQKEMKKLPYQLQGGFQTNNAWHWLFVQQSLVNNAIQGMVIGILIAWPVLVIATGNIIIGTFATVVICIITVCVVGIIPLAGWKLGVLTSINLCLVVGLSVDYVVHLAEGYHMSAHNDRLGRVHDMLEHVGVSVVSGAVTTLGAAFFMFFGKIQFFLQFGTFMFSCIGSSMLFSLGFFSTVLALCGPEGDTGSIYPLFRWINFRVIGRRRTDKECIVCDGKGFTSKHFDGKTADSPIITNNQSTTTLAEVTCSGIENPAYIEDSTKL